MADSIFVDRKSTPATNIRMMALLKQDTSGRRYKEGFWTKQSGTRRTRKGHLQEGEREPVRMPGGSGRPGRLRMDNHARTV